jgi:DNA-binding CsgD family transcriptional regulator
VTHLHVAADNPAFAVTPLRGRDEELGVLERHLELLATGVGSVVVIEGAPGFGKTRLLREVLSRAQQVGIRGGSGMADPLDRVVELAPVMEALFQGDRPLMDRGALRDDHTAPEQRFWLLQDLEALLETRALKEPLLICLDDLHWADSGTAAALRTLPKRLSSVPICWLLSTRPRQGSAQLLSAITELVDAGATRLQLRSLSSEAVANVVADILGGEPDETLLGHAGRTQGNPFLLAELVRGLAEEGNVAVASGRVVLVEDRMPRRVSDDMRQRLARLPASSARVAQGGASLGRRFTVTELASMTEVGLPDLLPALNTLIDAAIITEYDDRLAFGHDLVRDAVRSSIPIAARRALDRRGVDVLLARGALPVEVATQLADSAETGDRTAVETLLEATKTLAATDPAASAELAGRALALAEADNPLRGEIVARRAVSLFAAGFGQEAKAFADTALRKVLTPEHEAQVRLTIASMFVLSPDVRADNAREALALPSLPHDLRAWLEALVFHNLVVAGRTAGAIDAQAHVREAVETSHSRDARFAFELASGGLEYQLYGFEAAVDHLDVARRTGTSEDVRVRLAQFFRCWPLAALDRHDEALNRAVEGIEEAHRDRQNWAVHIFEIWRGLQALHTGRLTDAALALDGRFNPADARLVVGVIDAAGVAALGQLRIHLGDDRGAREIAQMCHVMLSSSPPSTRRHAAWFLASHAMAQGDPEQAHQMLRALGENRRFSLFPLFPHDVADDARLVHIGLAVGDEELVRGACTVAERRLLRNPAVASVQASAAHVSGLVHRSAADLHAAASLFGTASRPLAQTQALEDAGQQHLDSGDSQDAIEAFDRALVLAVDAGAGWDAARIRHRLRELGVRRRVVPRETTTTGWMSLTTAERGVAELAVDGLTNREIAQRLFISPHTVNAHLRHVFDKMRVRSRVELTRAVAESRSLRQP